MSWLKRKTSYTTDPVSGEPVATSREITWPGGRVETVPVRDLVGLKLDEKRSQQAEYGAYPSAHLPKSCAEMRSKAEKLRVELGLKKRALPASPRTAIEMRAKSRTLASELGLRTQDAECDCECYNCSQGHCEDGCTCEAGCTGENCGSTDCQCADHRAALRPVEGRTIRPFDIAAILEERAVDAAIYEARLKRKLAAASR
jgi:hypothetical protein